MNIDWAGVFPAVTTQLHEDLTVDLANTQRVVDDLIRDVGFKPATSIETGVAKFVEWYRSYHRI